MLRRLASQQILLLLYILFTIALTVVAKPLTLLQLTGGQLACLLFCGLNTLVGYGALAGGASERHYYPDAAVYPDFSNLLALFWPAAFAPPPLNFVGYSGAVVVVAGAMCSAVGHRWWPGLNRRAPAAVIKPPGK
ncbi:putative inner membrane transporter YhbE [Sodalis praecaptivus]